MALSDLDHGLVSRALSGHTLVLLGEISFALYLVHSLIAQILFAYPGFIGFGRSKPDGAVLGGVAGSSPDHVEPDRKPGRELFLALYDARRGAKMQPA